MKKRGYKKPNWFMYGIFSLCTKLYSKFFLNLKILKNELKGYKGSCVIIANHECVIDFMTLGATLPKTNFVISSSFYNTLPIQGIMRMAGVLPKQQFQTSSNDLKKMKEVVDHNMPLAIYPAGIMSEQGLSTPIPESTGKFLKWLKQDVYVAKVKGTYLTKPKWSSKWRKGKTFIEIYKFLSKDEIANLSNEELFNLINKELIFDSYKNQEELMIKYKNGNNIEGLESVLYKCPKCGKEFSIINKDNTLICTNCGNSATSDIYGFLNKVKEDDIIYKHPSDWAMEIEKQLYDEIINNDDFNLFDECEIYLLNDKKHKYEYAGNGTISLTKKLLTLIGNVNNEELNKEFLAHQYITLPFVPNKHFEIQDGSVSYRIKLKNHIQTTKWVWSLKNLYKIENSK